MAVTGANPVQFTIHMTGEIVSAQFDGYNDLYCKYTFVHGSDFCIVSGIEEGISQLSHEAAPCGPELADRAHVWNLPLEISMKGTTAHGWPQLVVSVYGLDAFGRDMVRGYGSIHLPFTSGKHELYVPMFRPIATTPLNDWLSWIAGRLPEFLDARFVSRTEGRDVIRVTSEGCVKVRFNVVTKDLEKFYQVGGESSHSTSNISTTGPIPSPTVPSLNNAFRSTAALVDPLSPTGTR